MDVESLAREFYEFRGATDARLTNIENDLNHIAGATRNGWRNNAKHVGIGGGIASVIFLALEIVAKLLGVH